MGALDGKIAIVTGGSRGIGRAIAERLGRDGAQVVVNYAKRADAAREVVSAIERAGGRARAVQADVSRVEEVRRLFDAAEELGGIDIVVANAGIAMFAPMTELRDEDYEQVFGINARGTFFVLREAAKRLRAGGRIIAVSTAATKLSSAAGALYFGSKAAIEQFARVLSKELGARGITVNIVSPGVTDTDMLAGVPQFKQVGIERSPLGRLGAPGDIAGVVGFLVRSLLE